MKLDPVFSEKLKKLINDYTKKGYIRKLNEEEINNKRNSWYLPIFVVKNINKPDKFRVVWDAAAKVQAISLNSVLLKGPDLLIPLSKVLQCFIEHSFGIVGDIKEMFHQIKIREGDQRVQRFIWREDTNQKIPDTYVMTVMTFGALYVHQPWLSM